MAWSKVGSIGKVVDPAKKEIADAVCQACAEWDGDAADVLALRVGGGWCDVGETLAPDDPRWSAVLRVCDAIVQSEGHFMATSGHIYPWAMIVRYGGRVEGDVLTWPDQWRLYSPPPKSGPSDPWDDNDRTDWRSR